MTLSKKSTTSTVYFKVDEFNEIVDKIELGNLDITTNNLTVKGTSTFEGAIDSSSSAGTFRTIDVHSTLTGDTPLTLRLPETSTDNKFVSFERVVSGSASEVGYIEYDTANDQLDFVNIAVDIQGATETDTLTVSGTSTLTGNITLQQASQDYLVTGRSSELSIQSQTAATAASIGVYSADGDGTDGVALNLFAKGSPSGIGNAEWLETRWLPSSSEFQVHTNADGTGTLRPLVLYTGGNTDQFVARTDGDNSMSGGLLVGGTGSPSNQVEITNTATATMRLTGDTDGTSTTGGGIVEQNFVWDSTVIAQIQAIAGDDAVNNDEGDLVFSTASAGSLSEVARFHQEGHVEFKNEVGIGVATPGDIGYGTVDLTSRHILHVQGSGATSIAVEGADPEFFWFDTSGTANQRSAMARVLNDTWELKSIQDDGTTQEANIITAELATGNVGVGRSDPDSRLEVSVSGTRAHFVGGNYSDFSQSHDGILLTSSAGNITNADYTPAVMFGTEDSDLTTTNPKWGAGILGRFTEVIAADTDSGMALDFLTTPDNAGATPTPSVRMTIDQDGNVGIGTDSPNSSLTVGTADSLGVSEVAIAGAVDGSFEALVLENTQAADAGTNETVNLRFRLSGGRGSTIQVGKDSDYQTSGGEDSFLRILTSTNGTLTEAVRWDSNQDALFQGSAGFNGSTVGTQQTYTLTNVSTDRTFDADSTTTAELADVLGTLISDLQAYGLLA